MQLSDVFILFLIINIIFSIVFLEKSYFLVFNFLVFNFLLNILFEKLINHFSMYCTYLMYYNNIYNIFIILFCVNIFLYLNYYYFFKIFTFIVLLNISHYNYNDSFSLVVFIFNKDLLNGVMMIHPPVLFIFYSAFIFLVLKFFLIVFYFFVSIRYNNYYSRNVVYYILLIGIVAIILGSW